MPADSRLELKQIWQIAPGFDDEPDTLHCCVEPAALFRTADGGKTWEIVRGLLDHPHRERWMPGGGGLCLHTIVRDPANAYRMWIAISSGGVYRTTDGGQTWTARNGGIRAEFQPEKYPEFGRLAALTREPRCRIRGTARALRRRQPSARAGDRSQLAAEAVGSDLNLRRVHMRYVDGFVLPVPKKNVQAYRRIAQKAGRVWREHGALEYRECVGDDLNVKMGLPFSRSVKGGETVVFSWIVFKSRRIAIASTRR